MFLYLRVHSHGCRYQWKPKEDTRSTGDALQVDVGTTWCPCWVSSSGPPQEQCILLSYPGLTYCNFPCSGYNSALLQTPSLLLPPFRVVPSLALLTTPIALGCGIFWSLCLSVWKTSSSRALYHWACPFLLDISGFGKQWLQLSGTAFDSGPAECHFGFSLSWICAFGKAASAVSGAAFCSTTSNLPHPEEEDLLWIIIPVKLNEKITWIKGRRSWRWFRWEMPPTGLCFWTLGPPCWLFMEANKPLGDAALLEEVRHWRRAFRVYSVVTHPTHPPHSLCFLERMSIWLAISCSCLHYGLKPSGTLSQNSNISSISCF